MPPEQDDTEVAATLQELEATSQNEQVSQLLEVLHALHDQQEAIIEQLQDQRRRVERIEKLATTVGEINIDGIDNPRDEAVLAAIRAGNTREFSLRNLRRLYKEHTDVCRDKTLRRRIKHLTEHGPFEKADNREWLYVGGPNISPAVE